MKLSEIKTALSEVNEVTFTLPNGKQVPPHFHVTEVGNMDHRLGIGITQIIEPDKRLLRVVFIIQPVDSDPFLGQFQQIWVFDTARKAPGCPHVDQRWLTLPIFSLTRERFTQDRKVEVGQ